MQKLINTESKFSMVENFKELNQKIIKKVYTEPYNRPAQFNKLNEDAFKKYYKNNLGVFFEQINSGFVVFNKPDKNRGFDEYNKLDKIFLDDINVIHDIDDLYDRIKDYFKSLLDIRNLFYDNNVKGNNGLIEFVDSFYEIFFGHKYNDYEVKPNYTGFLSSYRSNEKIDKFNSIKLGKITELMKETLNLTINNATKLIHIINNTPKIGGSKKKRRNRKKTRKHLKR